MEHFGKFQLLERIGEGGMAEIFLARPSDAALSKLIALKRILPQHSSDPYFREMFRREGEIALRFRHPSVVTVNELGKINGEYYMTMEFFPGKTLAQIILELKKNKSAIDFPERVLIIKNIAEALQYIHDFTDHGAPLEIIHRDISPQNIIVGFDGAAKLIDFGIAKINNKMEDTSSSNLKGKMAYMSPEQIRGEKLTKQTDIFSLGIVLWEVLAAQKLFTGKSVEEVAKKVEDCDVPLLYKLAPETTFSLTRICQKALMRDPALRYSSAGELAADLGSATKLLMREGEQRRLAKAIHELFAEDVVRLQEKLRQYEVRSETASGIAAANTATNTSVVPSFPDFKVPAEPPASITPPLAPSAAPPAAPKVEPPPRRTLTHSSPAHKKPVKSDFSWWARISVLVVCLGAVAAAIAWKELMTRTRHTELKEVPHEERSAKLQPVVLPNVQNPPHVPAASEPARVVRPLPATPVPLPLPVPAPVTVAAAPTPVAPPFMVKEPTSTPKPVERVAARPKPSPVERKPLKKASARVIAAQPPLEKIAFLTILADPQAKIFIDEKLVGLEVVNNAKVPADKKITVKVIHKTGVKVQQLQLKPYTRNVVEMAAEPK